MKKNIPFIVAGTLAGAFTVAAGLWSLYPENRALVADIGREIGMLEPLPPAPEPARYVITAGAATSGYMPATAVQGCSADGKIVRLIYQTAINTDERREEILDHPRINRNEQKYKSLRSDNISSIMQKSWEAEITRLPAEPAANTAAPEGILSGLDLMDRKDGDALQSWLTARIAEIYREHGLQVSFKVNTATALEIMGARPDMLNTCSPKP